MFLIKKTIEKSDSKCFPANTKRKKESIRLHVAKNTRKKETQNLLALNFL